MTVSIVRVTPQMLAGEAGREISFPVIGYVALDDGKLAGSFGLAWHHDRTWIWFGDIPVARKHAVHVVRWGQRMLRLAKQMGEAEVHSMRVEGPKSQRLHERLGFEMRGTETISFDGGRASVEEVWSKWLL